MKFGSLFSSFLLVAFLLFGCSCLANFSNTITANYISEELKVGEEDTEIESELAEHSVEYHVGGGGETVTKLPPHFGSKNGQTFSAISDKWCVRRLLRREQFLGFHPPFYILFCDLKIASK